MAPLRCTLNLLSESRELMCWKSKSGPTKVSLRLDSRAKCDRTAFNKVTWKMTAIRCGQPGVPMPAGEQARGVVVTLLVHEGSQVRSGWENTRAVPVLWGQAPVLSKGRQRACLHGLPGDFTVTGGAEELGFSKDTGEQDAKETSMPSEQRAVESREDQGGQDKCPQHQNQSPCETRSQLPPC